MKNLTRPSVSAAANVLRSLLLHNDKKHLFLTGSRGIGKSTLLSAALGKPAHGLISHAVLPVPGSPPSHVMLTRADTGASACIGRYQDRMTAVPDGFSLGLQAIRDFLQSDETDFVIDEIGYLGNSLVVKRLKSFEKRGRPAGGGISTLYWKGKAFPTLEKAALNTPSISIFASTTAILWVVLSRSNTSKNLLLIWRILSASFS